MTLDNLPDTPLIAVGVPPAVRDHEIALRDARVEVTWRELDVLVALLAGRLLDLVGQRRDRPVAIFARNSAEVLIAQAAALVAGLPAAPLNHHLKEAALAECLDRCDAALILAGPETADLARTVAAGTGCPVAGWRSSDVAPILDIAADRVAAYVRPVTDGVEIPWNTVFTSGTTGVPRPTRIDPIRHARAADVTGFITALGRDPVARLGPHLAVAPLYHGAPMSAYRYLVGGAAVTVHERFDAEQVVTAIARLSIASTVLVPTHLIRMLALEPELRRSVDVSSLRHVLLTGAACPPDVLVAAADWFGPVITSVYGFTEAGTLARLGGEDLRERPTSAGRIVGEYDVYTVDAAGNRLPRGEVGEIVAADRNDPDRAPARPGDIGYIDEAGYLYITDRLADLVVSGGVNVYPAQVERVLFEHPGVADVAVIGIPHHDLGEQVLALVIPAAQSVSADELIAFCRERLPPQSCPRRIEFVDTIGRNALGKLNKTGLRRSYRGEE